MSGHTEMLNETADQRENVNSAAEEVNRQTKVRWQRGQHIVWHKDT